MIFPVLYCVCSLKKLTLVGGGGITRMHSAKNLRYGRQHPPARWLIAFDLMTFSAKKLLLPLTFFPSLPLRLSSVCASLCAFYCLSAQSIPMPVFAFTLSFFLILFFCSPSALSRTPPPPQPPTHPSHFLFFLSLSNSSRILRNRPAAWGADLLAVIGSPRLPMRCEASATPL